MLKVIIAATCGCFLGYGLASAYVDSLDKGDGCAKRWAGSGYEARQSGNACVVRINGREFPEANIRVETSAFEVDYE
jgi:hypothetical protein